MKNSDGSYVQSGAQVQSNTQISQNTQQPNGIIASGNDKQTYREPLVIKNSLLRAFVILAIICIVISIIVFIMKQLKGNLGADDIYNTVWLVVTRIDNIAIFGRIACLGFAVAVTIIRVLNPHPYNTRAVIYAWVSSFLTLLAVLIFR